MFLIAPPLKLHDIQKRPPNLCICFRPFFFSLNSQSAAQLSDDELPADVDLNDPFFAEEIGKIDGNMEGEKKEGRQKKNRKKKAAIHESEEDKQRKVKRRETAQHRRLPF